MTRAAAVEQAARALLGRLDALIAESEGVAGLHRNGDVAVWPEITDGGQYEDWLLLEPLRAVLALPHAEATGPDKTSGA